MLAAPTSTAASRWPTATPTTCAGWSCSAASTYKVRDAQVIGFWMTSFLDNLFQNYISENGGNPKALVVALNR